MNEIKNVGPDGDKPGSGVAGFATIALCIVGVGGAVAAFAAGEEPDFVGIGTCLIASALSFGLLLNALLRA